MMHTHVHYIPFTSCRSEGRQNAHVASLLRTFDHTESVTCKYEDIGDHCPEFRCSTVYTKMDTTHHCKNPSMFSMIEPSAMK